MTFNVIAGKLQEDLIDIIKSGKDVNEYELIVYKYVFITELGMPVHEELGVEISKDSFILYIIPDDLKFTSLANLVEAFDKFEVTFMPNSYNILKLNFKLDD